MNVKKVDYTGKSFIIKNISQDLKLFIQERNGKVVENEFVRQKF